MNSPHADYPWGERAYPTAQKSHRAIPISERTQEELISSIEIHSDRGLGVDFLAAEGLLPCFDHQVDGQTVAYFSRVFNGPKRVAIIAYVPSSSRGIVPRTFYLSNSQGVWRYLPQVAWDGWLDKGHDERTLHMPAQFQSTLAGISAPGMRRARPRDPKAAFLCTTRSEGNISSYRAAVEERPVRLQGNFYGKESYDKVPPRTMHFFEPQQGVNFRTARPINGWQQETSQYGPLTIELFPSDDGKFFYSLARDRRDRNFVTGVETANQPLNAVGVKRTWVDAGCLTTPLHEYYSQSGEYGVDEPGAGQYVGMHDKYLSQIPFLRSYAFSLKERPITGNQGGFDHTIERTASFAELFAVLKTARQVRTSGGQMDASECIDLIEKVRAGQADVCEVTRTNSLRQKVIDLLRPELQLYG